MSGSIVPIDTSKAIGPHEQGMTAIASAQKSVYAAIVELQRANNALASAVRRLKVDNKSEAVDPRAADSKYWTKGT